MLVIVLLVALIAVVAAGIIVWSRGKHAAKSPLSAGDSCPDCGTAFKAGIDQTCSKCGRSLKGLSQRPRALPNAADDEEDDPHARTIVGSGRIARLKTSCASCGAALDASPVCPKCGVRQG